MLCFFQHLVNTLSYAWVISLPRRPTFPRLKVDSQCQPPSQQGLSHRSAGRDAQARLQTGRKYPGKGKATGKGFCRGQWSDICYLIRFINSSSVSALELEFSFAAVTLDCNQEALALSWVLIASLLLTYITHTITFRSFCGSMS